jgi:hypothetical protein
MQIIIYINQNKSIQVCYYIPHVITVDDTIGKSKSNHESTWYSFFSVKHTSILDTDI